MDLISYALSKKYTQKSLDGLGALKGANCTIKETKTVDGGTEVTFEWTGTSGATETQTILVKNGEQGNGIVKVEKIKTVGLIDTYRMTFDDGSTFDYEINNGGGSSTDEKVKLNSTAKDAKYLNELIDNSTIKVDTDNNYLAVKKIEGQTVTVADINLLTGVKSNIQEQINNLGKSMTMYGVFDTKADLLASVSPVPIDGNTAIVITDEDNNNKQMTYIYIGSTSKWTQVAESSIKVRDFTTNPINLSTEVTGTLTESKIDKAIARLADVLDKSTYQGSADGVVKQADTLTGLTATIAALNQAITDSHKHNNKTLLDKIVSDGLGSSFLADNGEYISILSIGTSAPAYTSQIWIDNTDTSKLILKIYDGTGWITVTGGGSITIDDALSDTSKNPVQNKIITSALNNKAEADHVHNYAGSSSEGGSATSAVKLDSSAGSSTKPVYFSEGKPVACSYTLGKSVPSNAVFTDTVYTLPKATTSVLGGVKVDGSTIAVDENGVIRAVGGSDDWTNVGSVYVSTDTTTNKEFSIPNLSNYKFMMLSISMRDARNHACNYTRILVLDDYKPSSDWGDIIYYIGNDYQSTSSSDTVYPYIGFMTINKSSNKVSFVWRMSFSFGANIYMK